MAYTVKKLAKISGVSVRTLHWYDQIGLLKPAYYGPNQYRYYEEEQLLALQQILFFRELGFNLDDTQKMLMNNDFDKIKVLSVHKHALEENVGRMKQLIDTVDKTISYLRGKHTMKDKDFYAGFDLAKQREYEEYLVKYRGMVAEDLIHKNIEESKKRTIKWGSQEWDNIKREGNEIYGALAEHIRRGLEPSSKGVQVLIQKHYQMIERF